MEIHSEVQHVCAFQVPSSESLHSKCKLKLEGCLKHHWVLWSRCLFVWLVVCYPVKQTTLHCSLITEWEKRKNSASFGSLLCHFLIYVLTLLHKPIRTQDNDWAITAVNEIYGPHSSVFPRLHKPPHRKVLTGTKSSDLWGVEISQLKLCVCSHRDYFSLHEQPCCSHIIVMSH